MKTLFTIFILLTGILTTNLLAQPWDYNFGTAIGSFITASSTSGFLPDPETNGGFDQVTVGNTGGGFALSGGSDSELKITAASGMGPYTGTGIINKFSVCDYTPGTSFSIGFNIRFECDASDNGRGYFFIGDGDYFTSADRYVGADLYTGIRWRKEAGNSFLFTEILNEAGDNYGNISEDFSLNTEYFVEIFGNNTASSIDYDYPVGTTQTLSAYSYDIWIDGSITIIDDWDKSSLTMDNGDPIDSYMILAEGSTDNNLDVIVDDFKYSNQLKDGPLPVELSSFTASADQNAVELKWQTKTEVNNYGFNVERRINESEWDSITFIEGHGNSNSPKEYSYSDKDLFAGGSKFQYRLKQVDNDGSFEYSDVVEVEIAPSQYELSQNYPNPFNPSTTIKFSLPKQTQLKINLYSMLGELVETIAEGNYEVGNYKVTFNAINLPSGVYVYRIESSDFVQNKKMMLLK